MPRPREPRTIGPVALDSRWLDAAAIALFAAAAAATAWRTASLYQPLQRPPHPSYGMIDFHHAVYVPAVAFLNGDNPYSAEYAAAYPVNRQLPPYSPGILPLHAVWGVLPVSAADAAYFATNLLLTLALAAYAVSRSAFPLRAATIAGFATLLLLSRPGQSNQVVGQLTLPLVVASLLALEHAAAKPLRAGVALAAALLKPTFGLPLLVLAVCRRRLGVSLIAVAVSLALAGAAVAWLSRSEGVAAFVADFRGGGAAHAQSADVSPDSTRTRVDLVAPAEKFWGIELNAEAQLAGMLVGLAPVAIVLALRSTRADSAARETALGPAAAAACCGVLVSVYHHFYDLLLLAPFAPALARPVRGSPWSRLRGERWALLALIVAMHANYLSSGQMVGALGITGAALDAVTAVNPALLAIATVVACRAAWREPSVDAA